jgi:hypothetical protein
METIFFAKVGFHKWLVGVCGQDPKNNLKKYFSFLQNLMPLFKLIYILIISGSSCAILGESEGIILLEPGTPFIVTPLILIVLRIGARIWRILSIRGPLDFLDYDFIIVGSLSMTIHLLNLMVTPKEGPDIYTYSDS